jgi:hypothetical protein
MTETPENRRKMAISLREQGYSLRRIASTLGMSKTQVARDLAEVSHPARGTVAPRSPVARAVRRALRLQRPAEVCSRCGELIPTAADGFRDGAQIFCSSACLEFDRRGIMFASDERPLRWLDSRARRSAIVELEDAWLDAEIDRIERQGEAALIQMRRQALLERYERPAANRFGVTPASFWDGGAVEFDDLGRRVQ